ncbi:MAG TPA: stage II sporulation protein M [Symbiobacteriaceae bacterium]|nr:stage II sporulation protein M [Symbiobacteriaceae bacterium]
MQVWRRLHRSLEDFLDRHGGTVLLLATLFVAGVIFGALAVSGVAVRDKAELMAWIRPALGAMADPPAGAGMLLLKQAMLRKLAWLGLFAALGISLVGVPGVMLLTLLRGFVSGFTVGFMVAEMGLAGLGVAIAGHLPQSLLELPALLIAATASAVFSSQVIRSWLERRRVTPFYPTLARFAGTLLATAVVLLLAGLVESYVSPAFVRLAATFWQGS